MPRKSPPDASLSHPKLRSQVEAIPVMQDGKQFYALRDRFELSDQQVGLPAWMAVALNYFDGNYDYAGIQQQVIQHFDFELRSKDLRAMCEALDSAMLLDGLRSRAALDQSLERYRKQPFRSPICVGGSYPASRTDLGAKLDELIQMTRDQRELQQLSSAAPRAILSPHIDYARGGATYARTWLQAQQAARDADLVVIIGTDHFGHDLFTLTRQHYSSPLGVLPTAVKMVDDLADAVGRNAAFKGELRHTIEHSLELPLVWLQHMRSGAPCEVIPILVGSLDRYFGTEESPSSTAEIRSFVSALHALTAGRSVLFVASGDLSHVGTAFGGEPVDGKARTALQGIDGELLQQIGMGDGESFYRLVRQTRNMTNVCGLAPFYLTLKQLGESTSGPIFYDTCVADETQTSFVTICGTTME